MLPAILCRSRHSQHDRIQCGRLVAGVLVRVGEVAVLVGAAGPGLGRLHLLPPRAVDTKGEPALGVALARLVEHQAVRAEVLANL